MFGSNEGRYLKRACYSNAVGQKRGYRPKFRISNVVNVANITNVANVADFANVDNVVNVDYVANVDYFAATDFEAIFVFSTTMTHPF